MRCEPESGSGLKKIQLSTKTGGRRPFPRIAKVNKVKAFRGFVHSFNQLVKHIPKHVAWRTMCVGFVYAFM